MTPTNPSRSSRRTSRCCGTTSPKTSATCAGRNPRSARTRRPPSRAGPRANVTTVFYSLFPSVNTMERVYATYGDVAADTGDETQCPSEFGYYVDDVSRGRVKCYIATDGAAIIVQTSTCDEKILVCSNVRTATSVALFGLWSDSVLVPTCL